MRRAAPSFDLLHPPFVLQRKIPIKKEMHMRNYLAVGKYRLSRGHVAVVDDAHTLHIQHTCNCPLYDGRPRLVGAADHESHERLWFNDGIQCVSVKEHGHIRRGAEERITLQLIPHAAVEAVHSLRHHLALCPSNVKETLLHIICKLSQSSTDKICKPNTSGMIACHVSIRDFARDMHESPVILIPKKGRSADIHAREWNHRRVDGV